MDKLYSIDNVTCVTPHSVLRDSSLAVQGATISAFRPADELGFDCTSDYYLYPALINIHDHLRGDYLPRVGPSNGNYYLNWSYWDNDLKSSKVYEERSLVSGLDVYYLGAYKNMLSGAVTVNDHFPHELNQDYIKLMPNRVIEEYSLAHECSSFDLGWGDGIEIEHTRAVKENIPFITHLEEGFDEESQQGIEILEAAGGLDEYTVLIHCIGFSDQDISKASQAGVHIVWCPASNMFMFNVTCKIRKIMQSGINVSIGTDSSATGSINLLEEMRFARTIFRKMYNQDLDPRTITEMVTVNPARALRMGERTGSLAEGKLADLLLIEAAHEDPYENLLHADMADIELLTYEGAPLYSSERFEPLFTMYGKNYTKIRVNGRDKLIVGDPGALLQKIRAAVGYDKTLSFMPIDI